MSGKKDTDYLSISSRVRAMENRLLTAERLERMIDARDDAEALKVLTECGYGELTGLTGPQLDRALNAARVAALDEIAAMVPQSVLVDVFRVKYDYHNAKVLVKARGDEQTAQRLLVPGGRYAPGQLLAGLQDCTPHFRQAVEQAEVCLADTGDPQQSDMLLDRACFAEMSRLAGQCSTPFMRGYVSLLADTVNLRACVRCARMDKDREFMACVLVEGGSVPAADLLRSWGQGAGALFRSGPLAEAAELADRLTGPDSGSLTELERLCDDALMDYQRRARRVAFGEEVVAGYLFAKEAELTAARTVMAGRMAGLEPEVIRRRLRRSYV